MLSKNLLPVKVDSVLFIFTTLLHFDPKSDDAWISLFKLTKNHKDTFFFVNVATSVGEATAILITVG